MNAYVIKDLEADMYLCSGFKRTKRVWEASKFSTSKEASEHTEFSEGYFQILKISYRTKHDYLHQD